MIAGLLGSQLHDSSLCLHHDIPVFPSVCLCLFFLLLRTQVIGVVPTLIHYDLIFITDTSAKTLLLMRSNSEVLGDINCVGTLIQCSTTFLKKVWEG